MADKVARIWWMGGTLRHPGNVFNKSSSDGTAEWNVFADPQAAAAVWDSKVPVTLVPLDATNKVGCAAAAAGSCKPSDIASCGPGGVRTGAVISTCAPAQSMHCNYQWQLLLCCYLLDASAGAYHARPAVPVW